MSRMYSDEGEEETIVLGWKKVRCDTSRGPLFSTN